MATPRKKPEDRLPLGRPPIYSAELVEEIRKRLSNGETLRSICNDPQMPSYETIFAWEAKYPEFSDISTRAREVGTHNLADECLDIANSVTDPDLVPIANLQINTRLRLIGQWNKKIYGQQTKLVGADGGAVQIEHQHVDVRQLSDDVRDAFKQAMLQVAAKTIEGAVSDDNEH